MKTKLLHRTFNTLASTFVKFTSVAGLALFTHSAALGADLPTQKAESFSGMYKIASSTDPMFPNTGTREYFMDFGKGIQPGRLAGNVAISMRENPHVKVRIMAWQYFPKQGTLVIGNPYSEGSKQAVVRAMWKMTGGENGVLFERENCQVVLKRADPNDY